MPKREWLIERIVPHKRVHLIGGPSGAGKTRWMFQTFVLDWQNGKDVLGFRSHPCPWLYVSADRCQEDIEDVLESMHIPLDSFRYVCSHDLDIFTIGPLIKKILTDYTPRPRLIIIDGFVALMDDKANMNDYKVVARWLTHLAQVCTMSDLTIIGTVHSPKMRSDSKIENPRQRVLSTVAWGAYTGTVFMIEPPLTEEEQITDRRRLLVLPISHAPFERELTFNSDGRLIEVVDDLPEVILNQFLRKIGPGNSFTTGQLEEALRACASRATIHRMRDRLLNDGRIAKDAHGSYRICRLI